MELLATGIVERDRTTRVFRHSPFNDLFGALVFLAVLVGWGFGLTKLAGEVPGYWWIVIGPIALVVGLLCVVVTTTLFGSFRSSLTEANWLARMDPDELFLNLRSYRNRHFTGDDPTVVKIGLAEIRSVGMVTETHVEAPVGSRRSRYRRKRTIELVLDADTAPLAEAVRMERNRQDPRKGSGGSSLKHHHVLVFVAEPGVVRVEWNKALFDALAEFGKVAPERTVDLDQAFESSTPEERALEFAKRGERFRAGRILREELDMEKEAADRWLEENAAA